MRYSIAQLTEMSADDRNVRIEHARQCIQTALDKSEKNTPELRQTCNFLVDIYLWCLNDQPLATFIAAAKPEELTFLRDLSVLLGKWEAHCGNIDAKPFFTTAKDISADVKTPEASGDWQVHYYLAKIALQNSKKSYWSVFIKDAIHHCDVARLMLNGTPDSGLDDLTARICFEQVSNATHYDTTNKKNLTTLAQCHSDPCTAAIPVMHSGHHIAQWHKEAKQAIFDSIQVLPVEEKQRALWSALIPGTALHAIFAAQRHSQSDKANYGGGFLKTIINELKKYAVPIADAAIVAALGLPKCSKLVAELRQHAPQLLTASLLLAPVGGHDHAVAAVARVKPMTNDPVKLVEDLNHCEL